jgi:opacity protein-like surface antigen
MMAAAAVLVLMAPAGRVQAQDRLSLDIRAGAAFATEDFGTVDLNTGVGFEALVRYRFMPHLGGYAGWDWYHFTADPAIEGASDLDIEDTGYSFGLIFEHPLTESFNGWVRGGGLFDHTEAEVDDDLTTSADHGFGWEAGAGFSYAITPKLSIMPGVRYRTFAPDVADVDEDPTLSYIATEVGLSWKF